MESSDSTLQFNNRVLICDDNQDIHNDLLKVLNATPKREKEVEINTLEEALFNDDPDFSLAKEHDISFEVDSAFQGKEAHEMALKAAESGRPYALVFMDVRMPPGWDGIRTVEMIWKTLPFTEVVIVTAYTDYSWDEMIDKLGINDKLLFIKKPFDTLTVKQLALNLTNKWNLAYQARRHMTAMEQEFQTRMEALGKAIKGM